MTQTLPGSIVYHVILTIIDVPEAPCTEQYPNTFTIIDVSPSLHMEIPRHIHTIDIFLNMQLYISSLLSKITLLIMPTQQKSIRLSAFVPWMCTVIV